MSEPEFEDVLDILRSGRPTEGAPDLESRVRAHVESDRAPRPPWGAFEEFGDDLYGHLCALLEGDTAHAEEVVVEAFARLGAAAKGEPTWPELLMAARHAALESLAKGGAQPSAIAPSDRALVLERRAGLTLTELARITHQLPALLSERLRDAGARIFTALEAAQPERTPACSDRRARLPNALLDLLDDDTHAADYAAHLSQCPACAGWTHLLEDAMTATRERLPRPDHVKESIQERLDPVPAGPSAEELGIQVAVSCCYCHDRLGRREAAFCATCLAPHHPDCFEEHGRCATPGCTGLEVVYPSNRPATKRRARWFLPIGVAAAVLVSGAAFTIMKYRAETADRAATYEEVYRANQAKQATRMAELAQAARDAQAAQKAQRPAPHQLLTLLETPPVTLEPGTYTAAQIAERWAHLAKRDLQADDLLEKADPISFTIKSNRTLDRNELRALLASKGIALLVGPGSGAQALRVVDIAVRKGSPVLIQGNTPVDPDQYASRLVKIRNSNGASIYANLRSMLRDDTPRVGSMTWDNATNTITITDLAHNIRRYEELVVQFDSAATNSPSRLRVEVYRVPGATWAKFKDQPSQTAIRALRKLGNDRLLESADIDLVGNAPGKQSTLFKRTIGDTTFELTATTVVFKSYGLTLKASTANHSAELSTTVPLRVPRHDGLTAKSLPNGDTLVLAVTAR